jgi:hypothetical protein
MKAEGNRGTSLFFRYHGRAMKGMRWLAVLLVLGAAGIILSGSVSPKPVIAEETKYKRIKIQEQPGSRGMIQFVILKYVLKPEGQ